MKISTIIPAAGSGSRYSKDKNKLLEELGEIPVIARTLAVISSIEYIDEIIICTSADIIENIKEIVNKYEFSKVKTVILGGETRQQSVHIGLKNCSSPDIVIIHDGARPLIDKEIIEKAIDTAITDGATIVAVPAKDTIKTADNSLTVQKTLNRKELWQVQTPQIFKYKELLNAHETHSEQEFTDDSGLIEQMGINVKITPGSYKNIKITTPEDLLIAKVLLGL